MNDPKNLSSTVTTKLASGGQYKKDGLFFQSHALNCAGSSPLKKDSTAPQLNLLERHLLDAGPVREDGSDKFWGLENVCIPWLLHKFLHADMLWRAFSLGIHEQVINYPKPTPAELVINSPTGHERLHTNTTSLPSNHPSLTYAKLMNRQSTPGASARNPAGPPAIPKPEDKEHPDFKKRVAQARGPTLAMTYDNAASYGMTESLFTSLKDIFEALYLHQSRIGVVSPTRFLEILKRDNEMFRTAMHQDAHEFLNLLLNDVVEKVEVHSKKLEEERATNGSTKKSDFELALAKTMPKAVSNNTGWVHELFEGTLTSETKCLTCENVSQRDEAFLDLSVDLDEHTSVTSCLRKFSEEEMLCERNKFHCDNCGGLQEAEKRMKIKRLPKILALHLKRFKYTEDLQRLQKLFHRVVYPYHLRLFNTTDDAEDPDRLYELYAVVVHIGGGPYHGHYVSIIKTEGRGWLLFDDELVEPVDKSYVQNFFGDRPGLACAYVLFYQETTLEAMKREQDAESQALATKAILDIPKENVGLGLKTNGFLYGIHQVKSAVSPASPDEGYDNLDRVATEPPPASANSMHPSAEVTALPQVPTSAVPPEDVKSKKERQKEDKERRAAARKQAKEEEEAERTRRKTLELKRREMIKKTDAETKLAIEASKASKAEDDKRLAADNGTGTTITGSLNRFKSSSKSFKKPKFLSPRESTKDEAIANGFAGLENTPPSTSQQPVDAIEKQTEKSPEKSKNRFSVLRKKTSHMIL
ncbi:MAG: hypothetical protein Q9217_001075 [Psora testacea]